MLAVPQSTQALRKELLLLYNTAVPGVLDTRRRELAMSYELLL